MLLEDDRLPHQLDIIEGELREELEFTCNISDGVWQVLGDAIGESPTTLRHASVSAALTSSGYIKLAVKEGVFNLWVGHRGLKGKKPGALHTQLIDQ